MATLDSFYVSLNEFEKNIRTIWQTIQSKEEFCDMTLACEDKFIQTHKVVVSAMSPVLANILKQNSSSHPYIYLKGVKFNILNNLLNYIHQGEVYILEEDINNFLEIGKDLQISGISAVQNIMYNTSEPSQQVQNEKRIVSTEEGVKNETIECVAESFTDLDMDCEINEFVGKKVEDVKNESSEILLESNTENEVKSFIKLNTKDTEPVKELVVYASELNKKNEVIHPYCDLCSRMYKSLSSLNVHKATIHKGLNYPCDRCDYKATQSQSLMRHIKTIHEGVRYTCDQCDKDYGEMRGLREHKKVVHDGVRIHCEMCGKKCRNTVSLNKHKKLFHDDHMSEK